MTVEPGFAENGIAVLFGCDDAYLPHVAAAIHSILAHANPETKHDFLLFTEDATPENRARLTEWLRGYSNAKIRFIDIAPMVDEHGIDALPFTGWPKSIYYRLFAFAALDRYNKAVYLDGDVICLDDISALYAHDMANCPLAACRDVPLMRLSVANPECGAYWRDTLRMEPGDFYFNSGVMVFDLAALRERGAFGEIMAALASGRFTRTPDQDVLNTVFRDSVSELPAKWNVLDDAGGIIHERVSHPQTGRKAVGILHYAGNKPWMPDYMGENDECYWRHAAETPLLPAALHGLKTQSAPLRVAARLFLKYPLQIAKNLLLLAIAPVPARALYGRRIRNAKNRIRNTCRQLLRLRSGEKGKVPPP